MRSWVAVLISVVLAGSAWGQANPVPPDDVELPPDPPPAPAEDEAAADDSAGAPAPTGEQPPQLNPSKAVKRAPGDAKVVAVLVSARVNLDKAAADRIASLLGQALESKLEVYVPSDASERLPDEGLPTKCVVTPECIRDLGQSLDADHLILLTAVRIGQNIQLDPIWVEVASGRALPRKSLTLQVDKDPREMFFEQARWLLPATEVRERPKQAQTIFVKSAERHMTTPSWIALGVTVAALAGATTFSLLARNQNDKLRGELDFSRPSSTRTARRSGPRKSRMPTADRSTAPTRSSTSSTTTPRPPTSCGEPPSLRRPPASSSTSCPSQMWRRCPCSRTSRRVRPLPAVAGRLA